MVDRDPDDIRADIDRARDQLAASVDSLTSRAHPSRLAQDAKSAAVNFVRKPAVAFVLAGIGTVVVVVVVKRLRDR